MKTESIDVALPDNSIKAGTVKNMFGRIAARYDLMNRLMTFGRDQAWHREVIRQAALPVGGRLLDIGSGTGGIVCAALDQDACPFLARKLRQGCGADLGGYSLRGRDARLAVSRGRQKGRAAGAKRLGCCGAT